MANNDSKKIKYTTRISNMILSDFSDVDKPLEESE